MTYLDWGCDNLKKECQSCLDALCSACQEDFKKKSGHHADPEGLEVVCRDDTEQDCDQCELEKKTDCATCGIILDICRSCTENLSFEFRIIL